MAERHLRCYARGRGDSWEAFCIDLDLAVQGNSLNEVRELLGEAIDTYVEDAMKEEPAQARRLLSRRAPLHVRARLGLQMLAYSLAATRREGDHQTSFEIPCHA
jgi:hypothetical protein